MKLPPRIHAWIMRLKRSPLPVWWDLRDVLLLGGLAALARGLHDIYPPSAWIAVGVVLMWLGRPN